MNVSSPGTREDKGEKQALPSGAAEGNKGKRSLRVSDVPFYISHIHRPSMYPTFPSLDERSDFADWVSVEDGAGNVLCIDVWVEDTTHRSGSKAGHDAAWQRLGKQTIFIDLRLLREVRDTVSYQGSASICVFRR
jgi:hypothetical protein